MRYDTGKRRKEREKTKGKRGKPLEENSWTPWGILRRREDGDMCETNE